MKLKYESWEPGAAARAQIDIATAICQDYVAQGYNLTLRQLYYQFVARGHIANNVQSYKNLGSVINRARLAGLLDWDYIVDRTRHLSGAEHFAGPQDAVKKAARSFSQDLWRNQPLRIEVWVEKEALAEVVGRAAKRNDVDYFCCRGYVSQSELWSAGQRLLAYIQGGQRVLILHLGDHDPSGIDMSRDIAARLDTFVTRDYHRHNMGSLGRSTTMTAIRQHMARRVEWDVPLEVRRIALNMEQVQQYNPPPNPAKLSDARAHDYIARYGESSWELDALEPQVMDALIEAQIVMERDDLRWAPKVREEEEHRASMVRVADGWERAVAATKVS